MIQLILGLGLGYVAFTENGRKTANKIGNIIIESVSKQGKELLSKIGKKDNTENVASNDTENK